MTPPNQKILVIRHGAFGDIIQIDGALRDIRARYPDAEIILLTTPPYARLMARCPHIDRVEADERAPLWRLDRLLALRRQLREQGFTKVVDLQCSDRTGLYRRLLLRGIPWSIRDRRLTARQDAAGTPVSPLDRYTDQLRADGIPVLHTPAPDISWMAEDMSSFLSAEGVSDPFIVLIPGSSARHPHKRWPHYAELAAKLLEQGYDVVTAPGPDELELTASIPGHRLLGPKGYLDWFELAGVLSRAAFVVGNDTGPSHMAACLNRPGLALFGPHTSAVRTGIRRDRFDAIEAPDLGNLSVDRVLRETLDRLGAHSNSV